MVPLNIDIQQILLYLLNFAILGGGLYLLLYGPVKKYMNNRQEKYRTMDEETKQKLEEAEKLKSQYEQQVADNEAEITKLKAQAMKEADAAAQQKLDEAEAQRKAVIEQAQKEGEAEKARIIQEANGEIEGIVSQTIDKLLSSKSEDPIDDFLSKAEEGKTQ